MPIHPKTYHRRGSQDGAHPDPLHLPPGWRASRAARLRLQRQDHHTSPLPVPAHGAPGSPRPWGSIIPEPYLLGSAVFQVKDATRWESHSHYDHELLWPVTGILEIEADRRFWTVGPGQGVWVMAGTLHRVTAQRSSVFGATFLPEGVEDFQPNMTGHVTVESSARELLLYMNTRDLTRSVQLRLQRACLDLFHAPESEATGVPVPTDARLSRMVEFLRHDPADQRSLESWSAYLHLSSRTVNRILHGEIGMTFTPWRRALRMERARALLAQGDSVTTVSRNVGYASTSAFISAFRDFSGVTPGRGEPGKAEEATPVPAQTNLKSLHVAGTSPQLEHVRSEKPAVQMGKHSAVQSF